MRTLMRQRMEKTGKRSGNAPARVRRQRRLERCGALAVRGPRPGCRPGEHSIGVRRREHSPDLGSGELRASESADVFQALLERGEWSRPRRARIGHTQRGGNLLCLMSLEVALPQCLPQDLNRLIVSRVLAIHSAGPGQQNRPSVHLPPEAVERPARPPGRTYSVCESDRRADHRRPRTLVLA